MLGRINHRIDASEHDDNGVDAASVHASKHAMLLGDQPFLLRPLRGKANGMIGVLYSVGGLADADGSLSASACV